MRNAVPARVLARRSRDLFLIGMLLVISGIVLDLMGIGLSVFPLQVPSNPGYGFYSFARTLVMICGAGLILIGIGLIVRALTWRTENPLAEQVGLALADQFDDSFTFIRNVSKLAFGYIDAVIVGPPGVVVLRITNREGIYYNEGTRWMRQIDNDQWNALEWSPTDEVNADAQRLRDWLYRRGLGDVPISGAIIFAQDSPLARVNQKPPVRVPAVNLSDFRRTMADRYLAQPAVDPRLQQRLTQLLLN